MLTARPSCPPSGRIEAAADEVVQEPIDTQQLLVRARSCR
jgi:hypothetical protein